MNCRRIFLPTALLSLSAAATVLADEPVALVRLTAPEIVALAGQKGLVGVGGGGR